MKRRPPAALLVLATLALLAAVPAHATPPDRSGPDTAELNRTIAQVRAITAKYHDVDVALADGYDMISPCVPQMGYHYQKAVADGVDRELDPLDPEILVYAPHANGELKLVAVEYASWPAAELFGEAFAPPAEAGEGPQFHTLHVWVWKHNPDGMFEAHNPKVSCQS